MPRANVVHVTGGPRFDQHPVGLDDVADVSEVPTGGQVAHGNGPVPPPIGFDDPLGQGGDGEVRGLTRADVVERPYHDHRLPVPAERLPDEDLGGQLARRVGGEGCRRGQLVEGHERGIGDRSVHLGRAGDQDPGVGPALSGRGQQRSSAEHVDLEYPQRVLPRVPDVGQRGQVVDGIGSGGGHRIEQRNRIGDVDFVVDGHHLVTLLTQMVGQPRADESSASGDQRAHDRSPYRLGWRDNGWFPLAERPLPPVAYR